MNDRSPTIDRVTVDSPRNRSERSGSRYSPLTVQIIALVGVASSSFPITVLSAALPDIADDLDTSVSTLQPSPGVSRTDSISPRSTTRTSQPSPLRRAAATRRHWCGGG